jgi:hypothetical protein
MMGPLFYIFYQKTLLVLGISSFANANNFVFYQTILRTNLDLKPSHGHQSLVFYRFRFRIISNVYLVKIFKYKELRCSTLGESMINITILRLARK